MNRELFVIVSIVRHTTARLLFEGPGTGNAVARPWAADGAAHSAGDMPQTGVEVSRADPAPE